MKRATIEFTATLVVAEDGDEWEGGEMSTDDAYGWIQHALARGDKHASGYITYGGMATSITYEEVDDEE
ncbi:hypothetical protein [Streptomyces albipurpureus]|uniref:Uncharacterized protein n=1 Tax=Streptomyces albipurpureus TaxID=2897419 RepID=A0ABT0UTI0_9ACTN|nr:hypothetical protein [Streptomyces sp. CWNU-1]MCM2391754.1 hypothetical protein [Streptomyces sp. CWNU-1]